MSLLEQYIGRYVEFTRDPRTLSERINRDGPFCYVGKLVAVDSHFALLSPHDIYRPEFDGAGIGKITLKDVVERLQKLEARRSSPNVADIHDYLSDENRGVEIRKKVEGILNDATREKLVPLGAICNFDFYKGS